MNPVRIILMRAFGSLSAVLSLLYLLTASTDCTFFRHERTVLLAVLSYLTMDSKLATTLI